MPGPSESGLERRFVLGRVEAWTRARFDLGDDAPIVVSEHASTLPGCPPQETVVAFWTEGDRFHHFKLFKPAAAVTEDDLPPRWMKAALAATETFGCACC
jgi:nitrate reductase delta subunit